MSPVKASREVREQFLQRLKADRDQTLGKIARLEELIEKAKVAEEQETDPQALRRYIQARINHERGLSEAKAVLLRTTKSIERQEQWLSTYEDEADEAEGGAGDGSGEGSEEEAVLSAVEKAWAGDVASLTISEIGALLRQYALLLRKETLDASDESLKVALTKALEVVDARLNELRRTWAVLNRQ